MKKTLKEQVAELIEKNSQLTNLCKSYQLKLKKEEAAFVNLLRQFENLHKKYEELDTVKSNIATELNALRQATQHDKERIFNLQTQINTYISQLARFKPVKIVKGIKDPVIASKYVRLTPATFWTRVARVFVPESRWVEAIVNENLSIILRDVHGDDLKQLEEQRKKQLIQRK